MVSNSIDVVENGAIVKVFLLEAALPSNAGDDILNAAGGFWGSYALTHTALGFLVEETETKKVLDFFAVNYVGAFLPDVAPPPPTPAPATPAPTPSATTAPSTPAPMTPPPTGGGGGSGTPAPTPAPMGGNATTVPTAVPTTPMPTTSTPATPLPTTTAPAVTSEPVTPVPVTPVPATPSPTVAGRKSGENSDGYANDVRRLSRQGGQQYSGKDGGGGGGGGGDGRRGGVGGGGSWPAGGGVRSGNGTTGVTWDNAAELMPESGFDEGKWLSANYVAKVTGLLYNDLTGWASTYWKEHPVYQPLSACGPGGAEGEFTAMGSADSYDFVWAAFERLASNGVMFEQQIVLPPKRTAMCLFPEGGVDAVDIVEAADNEEVEEYYRDVGGCVRDLAAASAAGNSTYPGPACAPGTNGGGSDGWAGEGGVSFLIGLGNCLEGQSNAYLYHNATSYLRLPLPTGSNTTEEALPPAARGSVLAEVVGGAGTVAGVSARTARLVRYAPPMPERPPNPPGGSDRAYIVYIAVALAAFGFAAAGLRMLYRRKKDSLAYGRGAGDGGAHGGIFSSSASAGWRSGGGVASDFGDFDTMGGSYEGALFPADNYSSGNLSGSRSHGSGRMGGWRGSGRSPSEAGNAEAENVELKRPLLNPSDSSIVPEGHQASGVASSRSTGGRGGAGAGGDGAGDSRRQGTGGARGSSGGGGGGGGGGRARDREGGHSSNRAGLSPPPFSRILGTMGGGPPSSGGGKGNANRSSGGGGSGGAIGRGGSSSEGRSKTRGGGGGGGGGGGDEGDEALDKGPFGGDDGGEEMFVGGGGGGGGGRGTRSLKRNNGPDGDEVFC